MISLCSYADIKTGQKGLSLLGFMTYLSSKGTFKLYNLIFLESIPEK